ncbi:MAG TPA: hypothetical protein VF071_05960 [Candidatus Limnocylindria bacterium]
MTEDRAREDPGTVPEAAPASAPEAQGQPAEGADLLSIGLLVFFVALLLIVAAMLTLPMVLG